MEFEHILFSVEEDVATLTLNRPDRLNSLDMVMIDETIKALDKIRDQQVSARVLVITGAERAFCTGAALTPTAIAGAEESGGPRDVGALLDTHFNPLVERIINLPIPVISAVNGAAAGAGSSIALAADIVIAARSAFFLQAFVNIGLVPDSGATWILPRLVGRARAARLMMLGERLPAEQAYEWGLISEVVDDDELQGCVAQYATRLATGPTVAYRLIKEGLRDCMDASFSQALQIERRNQLAAGHSADFAEARTAFFEKRAPEYKGR